MRDAVGNRIEKGQVVLMRSTGLIYKVIDVIESSISLVGSRTKSPARLVLEINIPIPTDNLRPEEEPQLADIFRIVDPQQEAILEHAMGQRKQ